MHPVLAWEGIIGAKVSSLSNVVILILCHYNELCCVSFGMSSAINGIRFSSLVTNNHLLDKLKFLRAYFRIRDDGAHFGRLLKSHFVAYLKLND